MAWGLRPRGARAGRQDRLHELLRHTRLHRAGVEGRLAEVLCRLVLAQVGPAIRADGEMLVEERALARAELARGVGAQEVAHFPARQVVDFRRHDAAAPTTLPVRSGARSAGAAP